MEVNEKTVVFSLILGVVPGFLLVICKVIREKCPNKKILNFCLDFTFTAVTVVLTYIGSIPLTFGRVRLLQVILELVSMLSVYYVFEPFAYMLIRSSEKIKEILYKLLKVKTV